MTSYLTDYWKNIWSIKFKLTSIWLCLYQRELPIKESFYKNNYPNLHQNWNSWMSKKLKTYIATSAGHQVVEPRWKMQVLFLVTSFVCCCYCSLFTFILFFFPFFWLLIKKLWLNQRYRRNTNKMMVWNCENYGRFLALLLEGHDSGCYSFS